MRAFDGDNDLEMGWLQHEIYNEMVVRLFRRPRDRYLIAGRLLRVNDQLAERLQSMDRFDHRILQFAHDSDLGRRLSGVSIDWPECWPQWASQLWRAPCQALVLLQPRFLRSYWHGHPAIE